MRPLVWPRSARIQPVHSTGHGRIASVERPTPNDFVATIEDYVPFDRPIAFRDGPSRNAQTSIQQINRQQYDKLVKSGGGEITAGELTLDSVREAATKADQPTFHPTNCDQLERASRT